MSALKQFFDKRRELVKQKRIHIRVTPDVVVEYSPEIHREEIDYYHAILMRNWFLEDSDIVNLMWNATNEVVDYVKEHINEYPIRVKNVLVDRVLALYAIPCEKLKYVVKSMTDQEFYINQWNLLKEEDNRVNELWQAYKKTNSAQRPLGFHDEDIDVIVMSIQEVNKQIEAHKKKKPAGYIPPSMRNKISPLQDTVLMELEHKLVTFENELKKTNETIKKLDDDWEEREKLEFKIKLYEM